MERAKIKNRRVTEVANEVSKDQDLMKAFHEEAKRESTLPSPRIGRFMPVPTWLRPYQFKPGQSGNPGGRPRVMKISTAVMNVLKEVEPTTGRTYAELIALSLVHQAINGNVAAARELREVTEGRLPLNMSVEESVAVIRNASDKDLTEIIRGYVLRLESKPSN